MAAFFSDNAHYTDVGLDAVGATGPDELFAPTVRNWSLFRATCISLKHDL